MSDEEIGRRLRALREQRAMPQQHVANVMQMSKGHRSWRNTTVAKIEAGERVLRASEVAPVAEILSCTVHQLLGLPEPTSAGVAIGELQGVILRASERIERLQEQS